MKSRTRLRLPGAVDERTAGALAELVEEQAGILSLTQLSEYGVPRHVARSQVRTERWQALHRGVYATFTGAVPREAQIWAAILRCGDGATASHETAAELFGLVGEDSLGLVHVTIPASRRVRGKYQGIVVHHAHRLASTRHPSLQPPRTTVEATVLDLIDVARSARVAEGWIVTACQRRKTAPSRLAAELGSRKKIRWRVMTESMLVDVDAGAESPLELEHLRAVERAHGLPASKRQRRVSGHRVIWIDADYLEYGVRVELDGRLGHEGDGAFRDRRRDNRGVVEGKATLRYGHAEVFGDACGVAQEQADVLASRGWDGSPTPCGPDCPIRPSR